MNITNYFDRIKISKTPTLDESGLFELQSSQLTAIAFENIDCLHSRVINTDIANLENKIFNNKRGGYCFELNGLFSHALLELGFKFRPLLARVMYRGTSINSRTHIILLVEINGKNYIADVGFGGPGSIYPIPFEIDREDHQFHGVFRITDDLTHGYIMQKKTTEGWFNVYAFNLDTVYPADLVMSNFFTSTYPESHFRHNLILARHLPNGRYTLLNKQFTQSIDQITETKEILNHEELLITIQDKFEIKLEDQFNFSWLFH